jgi:hypothetical protein
LVYWPGSGGCTRILTGERRWSLAWIVGEWVGRRLRVDVLDDLGRNRHGRLGRWRVDRRRAVTGRSDCPCGAGDEGDDAGGDGECPPPGRRSTASGDERNVADVEHLVGRRVGPEPTKPADDRIELVLHACASDARVPEVTVPPTSTLVTLRSVERRPTSPPSSSR